MQDDVTARLNELQQRYEAAQSRLEDEVSQLRAAVVQMNRAMQDVQHALGTWNAAQSGTGSSVAARSAAPTDTFGDVYVEGSLGVGTPAPVGRADIVAAGSGVQEVLNLISGGDGAGDLPTLRWKANDGRLELEMWTDSYNGYSRVKSAGVLALHAGDVGWGGANEFVTIQTSGAVGIGTTAPMARLDVGGGGILVETPDNNITVYSNSDGADAFVIMRSDRSHTVSIATSTYGKDLIIKAGLWPNPVERFRFTSTGEIQVNGVTAIGSDGVARQSYYAP
ncbi:MAG: hypothetical protein JO352_27430 [Chloroflexi bacterium]|nr:hypothetical protein [Chloroflexota bacterium]MBV9602108.1 hypothetical protein [Chloroflexota bacterium]